MTVHTARARVAASLILLFVVTACGRDEPAVGPEPRAESWPAFVDRFIEESFAARPPFAVDQGRHEFDGMLPDWSREGIAREINRLRDARAAALTFSNTELTETHRYQREYVIARIDHDLFWYEESRMPFTNPLFYAHWMLGGLDPSIYLTREYAPLDERMAAYTRYAGNIPEAARRIRENLETPMPRTFADLGANMFNGYASFFAEDVPGIFAEVEDEELQARFAQANAAAAEAMDGLGDWFEAQRENATGEFALGEALFVRMLRMTERVDTPVEELIEIGERDLERNLLALDEACSAFAPDASITECIARAQANKPEGGPVAAARRQLAELRAFLEDTDLVSIPGDEEALVEEAPPYQRWNFAYISIPGPYEQDLPSVYYIAPPDPAWTPEEQEAYIPGEADLLFTSVHEVWPGHFLNFLHAKRSPDLFGRLFVGYAFAEGWAHYSEEMMWEAGLRDGDPETRIGQLLNALMRNARYLCAIGLHTGGMSVDECEQLFRDKAYQDPGNARQQAARGTFDPAYLNYTMGKLLIRRLREDWTAGRGGRDAWKEFHDTFLSYGGPPVPLVRAQMMDEPPQAVF